MKLLKTLFVSVLLVVCWAAIALFLALRGWWIDPVAIPENYQSFYAWAEERISASNRGSTALVLIEDGTVVETFYSNEVDQDTLFPTASMSKWIAALSVVMLAERDQIDLDQPVSNYLQRWHLPDSAFDLDGVTTRRLLSHMAGLTDGLGFGDYEPDETPPSLEDSLRHPRASNGTTATIAVGIEPNSKFEYSGGGYLILELLVEEITGTSFAEFVQSSVFDELGMHRSTYAYMGDLDNTVRSFNPDGSTARHFQYASAAATGLSSTADDLTRLVQMYLGNTQPIVKPATITSMREPHAVVFGAPIWGLGTMLYAPGEQGDVVFGHDGANDPAINSTVRINPETRDGIIVLVTGQPSLATDIGSEWVLWQTGQPDFLSTDRAIGSAFVPIGVGALLMLVVGGLVFFRRKTTT